MKYASNRFSAVIPQTGSSHILFYGRGGGATELFLTWAARQGIDLVDQIWAVGEPRVNIDMVRAFSRDLLLRPVKGQIRLGIIPQAHQLTVDAAHALLKTLEDPPVHAMILLGAEQEDQLLPTIVSRCQRWHIREANQQSTINNQQSTDELRQMTYQERFKLAETWAKETDWPSRLHSLVRDARDLFHRGDISLAVAERLLGYENLLGANVTPRLLLENALLVLGKEQV